MLRKILSSLFLLPFLAIAAPDSAVHTYQLANGLRLFVKENHRAPVVLSSVWYRVGSGDEHNGITGISHVLEHMMFRGTKNYGPGVLEKLVNENGGTQNAMTTNDFTTYYQFMPADKLDLVLKLEADRMQNLLLQQDAFDKELPVIMEERRMRVDNDPNAQLYERLNATALINNPYHHMTIGWMTDIKNLKLADLKKWYETWYAPNNAFIVVIGDVNPDEVYAKVKKYFSTIPQKTLPTLKPRDEIASIAQKRVDAFLPAQVPMVYMAFVTPTLTTSKNNSVPYALDVLASAFCQGDTSRLTKILVREKRIANDISCSYNEFYEHENLFTISAVPNPPHTAQELLKAITEQIQTLQTSPISSAEINRIKTQVMAQKIYSHDALFDQAIDIGIPVAIGLPWQTGEDYSKNIEMVTAEQVKTAAATYLKPNNLTIGVLHPVSERVQ